MHPKKPIGFSLDFGLGFEYFENLGISILKVSKYLKKDLVLSID